MRHVEEGADWDRQWAGEALDTTAPNEEERTPRWRDQERLVRERLGGFEGLKVIEIGAGRGTNAFLYARRGASATLLDTSSVALEQAGELFAAGGFSAEHVLGDLFELDPGLVGAFDVSMSFGLCEHFLGERRLAVVRAHLDVLRPGGLAMIGVPNRWSPVYRAWMATLRRTGSWPLGTEVPFSAAELRTLVEAAGGNVVETAYGSFPATVVNHGVNQALFKLGRRGLRIPQGRVPFADRLAYELLVVAERPAPAS